MSEMRSASKCGLYTAVSVIGLMASASSMAQQSSTTQGVISRPPGGEAASPSADAAQADGAAPSNDAATGSQSEADIVVTGIRAAQQRAISIKRNAAQVVDAISAEDIGKLPDVTISDSLQRIPGVQIRREAGEGAAINIRGLPQVTTLLNGEAYLGANSINTIQPNFNDIPSQLFAGADVIKSTTADLLNAGITGTVNLRTRRPFDLKPGVTLAATAEGDYGDETKSFDPNINGLIAYHGDGWGALLSASYADLNLDNSHNGIQENYGVGRHNEGLADATSGAGFSPPNRPRGTPVAGGIDVNGDGDANDIFLVPQSHTAWDKRTERKRLGINASVQADLGDALSVTADAFYTHQDQYDRTAGIQFQNVNWQAGEFLPSKTRDTGVVLDGFNLNTIGVYNYDLPNFDSYSETIRTQSESQNYNLEFKYDNGGRFKGTLRGIYGKAHQYQDQSYLQFSLSNGQQWQPGGIGHYPASIGGDRPFNPGGYSVSTVAGLASLPAQVDFRGDQPVFTLPSQLTSELGDIDSYALKTISSENNFRKNGDLKVVRADGSFEVSDQFNVTGGLRYTDRSVDDFEFERAAPLYAGLASQPGGCLVKWKAFDVSVNDPSCFARSADGRAYTSGIVRPASDPSFNGQVKRYKLPVAGIPSVYVLDPNAMDDAVAFQNSFYPGNVETVLPGRSYKVEVEQESGYLQGNFKADIGLPLSGNFGVRIINTELHVTQNITGAPRPYGVGGVDAGDVLTYRTFTDVLPAVNIALDFTPKLRGRFAYTKTMTLLNLDQWGGGLDINYAIQTNPNGGDPIFAVTGGNSNGNPYLNPWRASNFDATLEYYLGGASLLSIGAFYIDVQSFIQNSTINRSDLPDNDGVVRGRTVPINTPVQGAGGTLKGVEAGAKLAFNDLGFSGLIGNFGLDANFTYSPSNSGLKDLAGSNIPFQDNSKYQANAAVFFQGYGLQARVAWNYRSTRAVSSNFGGVTGLELYQKPTNYFDASVSYDLTRNFTLFAQASNFTAEYEKYYLTFEDEHAYNNLYERRFAIGARAKF